MVNKIQPLNFFNNKVSTTRGKNETGPTMITVRSLEPVAELSQIEKLKTRCEEIKELRRQYWSKFVSNLTLHGYIQFHDATGFRKILWGCILCAMTCLIIYTTSDIFNREKQYEQSISLNKKTEQMIDFPAVSVCNFNPVYSDELFEQFPLNITKEEYTKFYRNVLSNLKMSNQSKDVNVTWVRDILSGLRQNNYTSYEEILRLFEVTDKKHINSDEVKLFGNGGCIYKDDFCDLDEDFKTLFRLTHPSICKMFNPYQAGKPPKKVTGTDIADSLFVYWDISGNRYRDYYGTNGIIIDIHPHDTPTRNDLRNTVLVEPGVFTRITIKKVKQNRLRPPFDPNCGDTPFKIVTKYPYSKSMCELDCVLKVKYP